MRRMRQTRVIGAAVLALIVSGVLLALGSGAATAAVKMPAPTAITVRAGEFYFKLSKLSIPKPGTVKFTVINNGVIAHDFVFQALNKGTKLLQPKQKVVLTVTFKKAGSYYYLCTVPRHAEQGMAGSFIVK